MKIEKVNLHGENGRFLQTTSFSPIRIHLDYTTLEGQTGTLTDAMIANIKTVMGKVVATYEGILSVKPSTTKLKVTFCDSNIKVSSAVSSTGVDADLVIFPFVDTSYPESVEAAASFCAQDATTNRPVAGYVAFNNFMDFSKTNAIYYYALLALHELNHVISFNSALFNNFIDSTGAAIPRSKVIISKTVNGVTRQLIATPKVIESAKKHFGCTTVDGVELENQGGSGTAGTHWEERIMAGDFMIGESYAENTISDMTLALMEDSGWYQTNYYTGGLFRFGKNQGCDFLNTKCVNNGVTKFPNEYSTTTGTAFCFSGRTTKGISSLSKGNTVESDYQYFTDVSTGGNNLADFCPIALDYNSNDTFFAYSCWNGKSTYPASMGEKIGGDSNCFISSLTPQNDSRVSSYKGNNFAICYNVTCSPSDRTYTVSIGTSSIKCPTAGGQVSLSGFDGVLNCPDYNLICTRSVACSDTLDCVAKRSAGLTPDYSNYGNVATSTTSTVAPSTTPSSGTTTTPSSTSTTNTTSSPSATTPSSTSTTPTATSTTPTSTSSIPTTSTSNTPTSSTSTTTPSSTSTNPTTSTSNTATTSTSSTPTASTSSTPTTSTSSTPTASTSNTATTSTSPNPSTTTHTSTTATTSTSTTPSSSSSNPKTSTLDPNTPNASSTITLTPSNSTTYSSSNSTTESTSSSFVSLGNVIIALIVVLI